MYIEGLNYTQMALHPVQMPCALDFQLYMNVWKNNTGDSVYFLHLNYSFTDKCL